MAKCGLMNDSPSLRQTDSHMDYCLIFLCLLWCVLGLFRFSLSYLIVCTSLLTNWFCVFPYNPSFAPKTSSLVFHCLFSIIITFICLLYSSDQCIRKCVTSLWHWVPLQSKNSALDSKLESSNSIIIQIYEFADCLPEYRVKSSLVINIINEIIYRVNHWPIKCIKAINIHKPG